MGLLKYAVVVFAVLTTFIGVKLHKALQPLPPPFMDEPYWGPGAATADDTSIKPFKISVDKKIIDDLKNRLINHRQLTPSLENTAQEYGINSKLLKEVITFWIEKYDWREREKYLNKFSQYKTQIQGLNIHYLHVKPEKVKNLDVVPLLLVHGWPGSVREFYEMIPILTTKQPNRNFVFEIIAPSLPGFGFSDAARKPELGAAEMAVIFKNLMERLGFEKYYLQGGDWGSVVVANMGTLYKDKILGIHSNMCLSSGLKTNLKLLIGSLAPSLVIPDELSKFREKLYPLKNFAYYLMLEMGYMHIQSTKPDTVGVGLGDSPVGLAAYILEKFTTYTNDEYKSRVDGGLKEKYKYEDLLDNIMIFWITNTMTTGMRIYSETLNIREEVNLGISRSIVEPPYACAAFLHELTYYPEWVLKDKFVNLVQLSHYEDAGHFAAFENPKTLAADIFLAVDKFRKLHSTA